MAKKYHRSRRSEIENMLWAWGDGVRGLRIPGLSLPSESIGNGIRSSKGAPFVPNYWPDSQVVELDRRVAHLRQSLQELVRAKYVAQMSVDEIKRSMSISDGTYFAWIKEALTYLSGAMGIEQ